FRASEHRGLAARIPLEHATAMIESVSAQGELVGVQVYGHPWVMGEYWPMITPCFQVHAVDDAGNEHNGMPGDWQGFPGNEGHGSFFLWPPVDPARKSIRVTVSTLWEAAWAEVELPRRLPWPNRRSGSAGLGLYVSLRLCLSAPRAAYCLGGRLGHLRHLSVPSSAPV